MRKVLIIIAVGLFVLILIESIFLINHIKTQKETIQKEFKRKTLILKLKHEKINHSISEKYETKKYLATGNNNYERIFNKQNQSILELLHNLAQESFPNDWNIQVKVEEFKNFISLVHIGNNADVNDVSKVSQYIIPVLKYGAPYISNVAIFNSKHECNLFFDKYTLRALLRTKTLSRSLQRKIRNQGSSFTRFNSIRIEGEKINNHLIIPVSIYGAYGLSTEFMMLDTGATMTVISLKSAQETGNEDLNNVQWQKFNTANGEMSLPIVNRKISLQGLDKKQNVAVSIKDGISLLGMDFFEDKKYIIDMTDPAIYVWSK